jgi:cullin 1
MHARTLPLIERVLDVALLVPHSQRIVFDKESGFVVLVDGENYDALARMYRLMIRLTEHVAIEPMAELFRTHIESTGSMLMVDEKQFVEERTTSTAEAADVAASSAVGVPSKLFQFVDQIMNRYRTSYRMYTECFARHSLFHQSIRQAFKLFLNKPTGGQPFSVLLALYVDEFLRSPAALDPSRVEQHMTVVAVILSYLREPDVFLILAQTLFMRRLLDSGSRNPAKQEAERLFIDALKRQFGNTFTGKLEGMFSDFTTQPGSDERWKQHCASADLHSPVGLETTVLTQFHWPPMHTPSLTLPKELADLRQAYTEFYANETTSRELRWPVDAGTVTMTLTFSRPYEATMHLVQGLVLHALNAGPLSLAHIVSALNIEEEMLKLVIPTLTTPALPLVVHTHTDPTAPPDILYPKDMLQLNPNFVSEKPSFELPPLTQYCSSPPDLNVEMHRRMVLEATIVRLMKTKRECEFTELVVSVPEQIRDFTPTPVEIRKAIEDLIQRNYLARHPESRSKLVFVP